MSTEKQEVLAALQDINWPGSDQSLEQQDRIGAIELEDAELVVELNLTALTELSVTNLKMKSPNAFDSIRQC